MPTLRERIAHVLLGSEIEALQKTRRMTESALQVLSDFPRSMQIGESMDPEMLDWMIETSRNWEPLLGQTVVSEQHRKSKVRKSRQLTLTDPNAERQIELWTDFGFGRNLDIDFADEAAGEWWTQFWESRWNAPVLKDRLLHNLSTDLLIDGEIFFCFYTARADNERLGYVGGLPTVRTINPDEIVEILTDPDDAAIPIYYKRQWTAKDQHMRTRYYPDMAVTPEMRERVELPQGAEIAGEVENGWSGTDVCVMHAAYLRRGKLARGWPLLTTSGVWLDAYKDFLTARLAVAQAVYTYVDKLKVQGGSRAVDAVIANVQSSLVMSGHRETNPNAVPGSDWVENQALDRQRMPLGTGASDAEKDSAAFLAMAGGAGQAPAMFLGRGELVRMAVAEQMMEPIRRQWQRYQSFWSSVWGEMIDFVLLKGEQYGGQSYASLDREIYMDALSEASFTDMGQGLTAVSNLMQQGVSDSFTLTRVALFVLREMMRKLGIRETDQIFGDLIQNMVEPEAGKPVPSVTPEEAALVEAARRVVAGGRM